MVDKRSWSPPASKERAERSKECRKLIYRRCSDGIPQMKGIYKVQIHHLSSYPFSKLDVPVSNNAISLTSSKVAMSLRNDRTQDWLQRALPGYLRILKATPHLHLYNFLLDSYVAVTMIEDTVCQVERLVDANLLNILKQISAEIDNMTLVLVNKDASIFLASEDSIMDIDESYGAEKRGEYRDMDSYEVLGIKSMHKTMVLSEWRD